MTSAHAFENPRSPINTHGDHAVIAAGAVVVRDVPAFGIAAGVPAKEVRYRGERNC
jgi:acetyltransferase-like isoleucine patch superfamily enzyme